MIETLEKEKVYIVDEYFEIDQQSEEKLEYHNGKIITMSGGTETHSKIAAKIITALSNLLDDQPFDIYTSDVKVQIPEYGKFVYADVSVVSGLPVHYQGRARYHFNPLLVVEVLSPSTKKHDRSGEFMMCRTLPSLKEYVLLSQDQPMVTTFFRNQAGHWEDTDVSDLNQSVRLRSVGEEIPLARIYKDIDFAS